MYKIVVLNISILLIFTSCQEPSVTPQINSRTPESEHIQTSEKLKSIMYKFDSLIFKHFQSDLERDKEKLQYTKEMATLLDELAKNTKELKRYSAEHSEEYLDYANALEEETRELRSNIVNYQTRKIGTTLENINSICKQCHASLSQP